MPHQQLSRSRQECRGLFAYADTRTRRVLPGSATDFKGALQLADEVLNVRDREARTLAMRENLELARDVSETSFQRYQTGVITVLDLLLSLRREEDTAENFLEGYLSWRSSLRSVQEQTYFDFELGVPVLERFGVQGRLPQNGVLGIQLPKVDEGPPQRKQH